MKYVSALLIMLAGMVIGQDWAFWIKYPIASEIMIMGLLLDDYKNNEN